MNAVREVLAEHRPGYRVDTVVLIGAGLEHVAYEVNADLIVRFGRSPDPAQVEREARLLAAVATLSPLPVPVPLFTHPERGCLVYRRLAGVPLLDLAWPAGSDRVVSIAATLGAFLRVLHDAPADRFAAVVGVDRVPLIEWREEAASVYPGVTGSLPARRRGAVEAFLAAPPPPDPDVAVFSHNDLGIEHVLVEPDSGAVTGILDWTDAAVVDPACDFGRLYRDLGPSALGAALDAYRSAGGDDEAVGFRDRVVFYARCSVLEDLAYGLGHDRRRYVEKSLAALEWIFPT